MKNTDVIKNLSNRANAMIDPRHRVFSIFLKLQEEMGEFATAINIPEKCDEHYSGEAADIMIAFLDLYLTISAADGVDVDTAMEILEDNILVKSNKWKNHLDKMSK